MMNEAYNQIKLYRDELRDPGTNLWSHVALGTSFQDLGLWATGGYLFRLRCITVPETKSRGHPKLVRECLGSGRDCPSASNDPELPVLWSI